MAGEGKGLSVGDPIEVRRATPAGDAWLPATVQFADEFQVVAVYADGQRHAVKPKHVRRARSALSRSEGGQEPSHRTLDEGRLAEDV